MPVALTSVGHRFPAADWLFRGVSITFVEGKTYAVTGPSGSGKSTLLSLLAGWQEPVEGEISRAGVGMISWVFQNSHGTPRRSAVDHVVLPLIASGLSRETSVERATGILGKFNLSHVAQREFRELSGGEAQRLMLARASAANPHLMLIDEPTAQLDSKTSHIVNEVISSLAAEGRIVIVATHDAETSSRCDYQFDLREHSLISGGLVA